MRLKGPAAYLVSCLSCSLISCVAVAQIAQQDMQSYLDPNLPAAFRAHDLVSRMTLEEKASLLEDGAEPVQRPGVPSYETWSEALHGIARAGCATVFPQAIGMAATWDPAIVRQMGEIVAIEGRVKFNHVRGRFRGGGHCASAKITPAPERLCCFA
jgi:beta-glucosidase